jgi:hypothetical protein
MLGKNNDQPRRIPPVTIADHDGFVCSADNNNGDTSITTIDDGIGSNGECIDYIWFWAVSSNMDASLFTLNISSSITTQYPLILSDCPYFQHTLIGRVPHDGVHWMVTPETNMGTTI